MSDKASFTMCVLWEDELRAAATALAELRAIEEDDAAWNVKAVQALNACLVALHDLTDDKVCVMIGAGEIRKRVQREPHKGTTD